ncbi:molybdenum cofactor biosynthesis protein MoeA [Sphingomonas sp. Leaf33]|uniref:molybdopterin molybdotransferase MoeA n=1 Tax=Sphingomonas sp. Leaf33 TaxID=1736215 RepID=UPI0006F51B69|nr:gephyrin-like molybdotransferase Glp [Sphingomonas sp. Leaf33]KQN26434.1 molybdenum cofactor biosynthesis protein MoeA [Sphingomonas sp. Leaf33]
MPLLPVADAQARVLALAAPLPVEQVPLADAAHRYAAADVPALRTQPASDLSAMDGYAIRHADLGRPLRLIGESAAGRPFTGAVRVGETVRIFTGATMPAGADCVLVQEEARAEGGVIHLAGEGPAAPGRNVRRRGLDFTDGDVLIPAGAAITPARLAVAAIGGHATLPLRARVRVAIAATGDELVSAGQRIGAGQLPESNGVMLAAMLSPLGADIVDLGILPDRADALEAAFRAVDADVLVTTGGASVGDHDLVRPALEAAGAAIDFWRIALRPGKPMMAGRLGSTVVLGLPGNPVSAFVTAELFVKPLVRHLAGAADPFPGVVTIPLGEDLPANTERTDYLRAELRGGAAFASTIQDSSMLRTLARSTCLIVRPPHAPVACEGDSAEILMIA